MEGYQNKGGYEEKAVGSVGELVQEFMQLRADRFWSFRGQRREDWNLGLHPDRRDPAADVCLQQFKKRCMEFSRPDYIEEHDEWRWLFLAQHHRLRTRLLDWTTNPLVALYFAVENIVSSGDDNDDYGAVWALRVKDENFTTPKKTDDPHKIDKWVMINPPPVTQRIVRQSGKFSYHPSCDEEFIDLQSRRCPEEQLKKIVIRRADGTNPSEEIRQQLGIMNVHHAALFPDIEGVANFINWEWKDIAVSFLEDLDKYDS